MKKKDLIIFSIGLVSATLIFQFFVAALGSLLGHFIPNFLSNLLNIIIGLIIIYYGYIRLKETNNPKKNNRKRKK